MITLSKSFGFSVQKANDTVIFGILISKNFADLTSQVVPICHVGSLGENISFGGKVLSQEERW